MLTPKYPRSAAACHSPAADALCVVAQRGRTKAQHVQGSLKKRFPRNQLREASANLSIKFIKSARFPRKNSKLENSKKTPKRVFSTFWLDKTQTVL